MQSRFLDTHRVPFLEERIQPEEEEGRHRNRIGTNALGSTEEGREAPQRHLDPAGKDAATTTGSRAAPPLSLHLLGVGPRSLSLAGLFHVPVYALSLYVDASQALARLAPSLTTSPPPPSYYATLLSPSSPFPPWSRALYLSFCRAVGTARVLQAFDPYPRLAAHVRPAVAATFEAEFGEAGIQAGHVIGFVWVEGRGLLTVVRRGGG